MRAEGEPGVETVGQRLRRLRRERGLSQRELASPGVSYAYISRIEAGARRPSVKALRRRAPGVLSPLAHADVYATLARAYSASGQPRRAVELLEDCLSQVQAQAPEDISAEVRFATYLSYALSDLGELERAKSVVGQALGRAQEEPDPYSRVRLYW